MNTPPEPAVTLMPQPLQMPLAMSGDRVDEVKDALYLLNRHGLSGIQVDTSMSWATLAAVLVSTSAAISRNLPLSILIALVANGSSSRR